MTNQRVARGLHTAEASRVLPIRRGERPCLGDHKDAAVREGAPCPDCGAVK